MNPRAPAARPARLLLLLLFAVLAFAAGYVVGAFSVSRQLWPIGALREFARSAPPAGHQFDALGRLLAAPGKTVVDCPVQDAATAVLLVIGQSNAANHAGRRFTTTQPGRVVNLHAGRCTVAASPLLGATGTEGEFATPLADALVRSGSYASVVIVAAGVGETPISRWQRDGDLNEHLLGTLREVARSHRITHIVWHQGESDAMQHTTAALYSRAFALLRESLAEIGVNAPVFLGITTRCGPAAAWQADNPTARALRALVDDRAVFLGADTDALLTPADRRADACHLSASGQRRTAEAYAQAIGRQRLLPASRP